MSDETLVAPIPFFGGKRRAAELVWPHFGNVQNYVEPFCGSLAVLLAAPVGDRVETANDINGFIVNMWRSLKADPEAVAWRADWPVTEIDLEARHGWLINRANRLRWSLEDPDFYDAKIAGWYIWGACAWIGSGWCLGNGPWVSNGVEIKDRQLPHLGNAGRGINRKLPHTDRAQFILDWFQKLSDRLRDVRIACGDWQRVLTPVVTTRHGVTAVFLDPPYNDEEITTGLYAQEGDIHQAVLNWCLENGGNRGLRIALCGYDGEYDLPGWTVTDGAATNGGYGNAAGNKNKDRETIWFSPHCDTDHPELFKL